MRLSSEFEDDVPNDPENEDELDERIFSEDTPGNAAHVAFGSGLSPDEALSLLDDLIRIDEDAADESDQEL